jgi:hypothetical protein
MDTLECNACHKQVVPRLWHYQPLLNRVFSNQYLNFTHLKTQHICPLCGAVMYLTGGQITLPAKLVLVLVACMFVYGAITKTAEKLSPQQAQATIVCKGTPAQCKAAAGKQK